MAVVKGSLQHKLVIRQERSGEKRRRQLIVAALVLVAAGVGFGLGWMSSGQTLSATTAERDRLHQALAESELTVSDLAQKVGILETGGEVDRQAANEVRDTIRALKIQVAGLEEEVSFYKGIMVPGDKPAGLQVGKVLVSALEGREYRYVVTMTQIAERRRFVSGTLTMNVIGQVDGKAQTLPLHTLDSEASAKGVRFRFRYFQELRGTLTLPEGFEPQHIQLLVKSAGKKPQRVEQTIDWPKGAS